MVQQQQDQNNVASHDVPSRQRYMSKQPSSSMPFLPVSDLPMVSTSR